MPPPLSTGHSIESISPIPLVYSDSAKVTPSRKIGRISSSYHHGGGSSSNSSNSNSSISSKTRSNNNIDDEGFALDTIRVGTDLPALIPMPGGQSPFYSSLPPKRTSPSVPSSNSPSTPSLSQSKIKRMINGGVRPASLPRSLVTSKSIYTRANETSPDRSSASNRRDPPIPTSSRLSMAVTSTTIPRTSTPSDHSTPLSNITGATNLKLKKQDPVPNLDGHELDLRYPELSRRSSTRTEPEKAFVVEISTVKRSVTPSNSHNSKSLSLRGGPPAKSNAGERSFSAAASDVSMGSPNAAAGEGSAMEEDNLAPLDGVDTQMPENGILTVESDEDMLSSGISSPPSSPEGNGESFDLTESPPLALVERAAPVTIDLTQNSSNSFVRSGRSRSASISSCKAENLDSASDVANGAADTAPNRRQYDATTAEVLEGDETDVLDSDDEGNNGGGDCVETSEAGTQAANGVPAHTTATLPLDSLRPSVDVGNSVPLIDYRVSSKPDPETPAELANLASNEDENQPSVDFQDVMESLRRMARELENNDDAGLVDRIEHVAQALTEEDKLSMVPEGDREGLYRYCHDRSSGLRDTAARIKSLISRVVVPDKGGEIIPFSEYKERSTHSPSVGIAEGSFTDHKREAPKAVHVNGASSTSTTQAQEQQLRDGNDFKEGPSDQSPAPDLANDSDCEWSDDENTVNNGTEWHQSSNASPSHNQFMILNPRLQPASESLTNTRPPAPKSVRANSPARDCSTLGQSEAWPKDGRNVNLKHIQAYYGLSQEQAKEFLTKGGVARAVESIRVLKEKFKKPSVPSINTVRTACRYDEMYGVAPKDFLSGYIKVLGELTKDVPEIQRNPRTGELLKKDDMCGNAHSILLAATRYRNRILGTLMSEKKSPTAPRPENDGIGAQQNGYHHFAARQESPTPSRPQTRGGNGRSTDAFSPARTRAAENWDDTTLTASPHQRQTVTIPFRQEEKPMSSSTPSVKESPGVMHENLERAVFVMGSDEVSSVVEGPRRREPSVSESVTSMASDNSLLRSDRLQVASATPLSMVAVGQKEVDDICMSDETALVATRTLHDRASRRKTGRVSLRESSTAEMMSLITYPARYKQAQRRLARETSNTMLELINNLRQEKTKNEKNLENLELELQEKLADISCRMEKMRTKAAFYSGNEVDYLTDEDLERVERADDVVATRSDRQMAKIDWTKYQELDNERAKLENDARLRRGILIQEGIRIDRERDNYIKLKFDMIDLSKALDGNEVVRIENSNNTGGSVGPESQSSFKLQEGPLVRLKNPAEEAQSLLDHMLGSLTPRHDDEPNHGYCTRKRLAVIHGPPPDNSKRRRL